MHNDVTYHAVKVAISLPSVCLNSRNVSRHVRFRAAEPRTKLLFKSKVIKKASARYVYSKHNLKMPESAETAHIPFSIPCGGDCIIEIV